MDYGTAAVIIGTVWAIGGVIIMRPRSDKTCPFHSDVKKVEEELWSAVKEMRDDIKELLQRTAN
jgi:hypothetical protein